MDKQKQNLAIIKALGWTVSSDGSLAFAPRGRKIMPLVDIPDEVPNFVDDLNAMHKAEVECIYKDGPDSDIAAEYLCNLVICADAGMSQSATAAQRAKAFQKTFDLWEE